MLLSQLSKVHVGESKLADTAVSSNLFASRGYSLAARSRPGHRRRRGHPRKAAVQARRATELGMDNLLNPDGPRIGIVIIRSGLGIG